MRGFALLTVLVVVAAVGALSGTLLYQLGRDTLLTAQLSGQSQAFASWRGMENWAQDILWRDLTRERAVHLKQDWARRLPPVPFAGGMLQGWLEDLQGRINLNNMQFDPQRWVPVLRPLLRDATDRVADWLDPDDLPRAEGAEDETYLLAQPPYRAANRPLVLPAGLYRMAPRQARRWLQAWSEWVTALPSLTPVNVNTASLTVLTQLGGGSMTEALQAWVERRQTEPAGTTRAFRTFLIDRGVDAQQVRQRFSDEMITVTSNYFLLRGEITYGELTYRTFSLLYWAAPQKRVVVVLRWLEGA